MFKFGMDDVKRGDLVICISAGMYMIKYKIYKIRNIEGIYIEVCTEKDGFRYFTMDRFISVKWLISEE